MELKLLLIIASEGPRRAASVQQVIIVCVVWIVYGYVFGTSPFGIQITYAGGIVALATQIIVTLVTTRSGERSDSYQLYKEARKEMKAAIAAGKRV